MPSERIRRQIDALLDQVDERGGMGVMDAVGWD